MAEPLFAVSRIHLDELSDGTGIWQHARGTVPNPAHGYCTDDVARALQVDLMQARTVGWEQVAVSARRSLRFLEEAFEPGLGRFRNFRSAAGEWLERVGSEDCQARASLALAEGMAVEDARFRQRAAELFRRALPATLKLQALRPQATTLLGCVAAIRAGEDGPAGAGLRSLTARLAGRFEGLSEDWPWPEATVTYENGLPPRALIVAGEMLANEKWTALGLRSLDWLGRVERGGLGHFSPVGNAGWWPRGGAPARFDQQPIEAASMLMAAADAFEATGEAAYADLAEAAYDWFLGANDLGVPLCDPVRGGCRDALTGGGMNSNQGAESTLAWLASLERMRQLRRRRDVAVAGSARVGRA